MTGRYFLYIHHLPFSMFLFSEVLVRLAVSGTGKVSFQGLSLRVLNLGLFFPSLVPLLPIFLSLPFCDPVNYRSYLF